MKSSFAVYDRLRCPPPDLPPPPPPLPPAATTFLSSAAAVVAVAVAAVDGGSAVVASVAGTVTLPAMGVVLFSADDAASDSVRRCDIGEPNGDAATSDAAAGSPA